MAVSLENCSSPILLINGLPSPFHFGHQENHCESLLLFSTFFYIKHNRTEVMQKLKIIADITKYVMLSLCCLRTKLNTENYFLV